LGRAKQKEKKEDRMPYWRLFYHFVWTTKNREPLLTPDIDFRVHQYSRDEADKHFQAPLCFANGMPDHVHVLASVRPAISPADFVKQLKGASSRWFSLEFDRAFEWQEGYGVLSVSEKETQSVINYIKNQKARHANKTRLEAFEETQDWNGTAWVNSQIF
jgi:putative transposase